ncbi:MAG: hypothetical protein FD129_3199, partial [bacterium]
MSGSLNERLGRLARGHRETAPRPEMGPDPVARRRKPPPDLATLLPG